MAKPGGSGHSHGRGDEEAGTSRPQHPVGGVPKSIAESQAMALRLARAGRSTSNGGEPLVAAAAGGTTPGTHPTGQQGGSPEGRPTRIGRDEDDDVRRSLERENETAVILADKGFRTKQNPTPAEVAQARQVTGDTGNPGSKPDYLVEGRVFDCYAPAPTRPPRSVWDEVETKVVRKRQTQRVVINLQDWRGDMAALRQQFDEWPIERLKEVKVIRPDGTIAQLFPDQGDD